MEFKQPIGESLTSAIDMAHTLQRGGANIATITNALAEAGFPKNVRATVGILLSSELEQGYKPTTRYQGPDATYQPKPPYP